MTVPVGLERDDYVGNNTTDTYDYNFQIYDKTELLVVKTDTTGAQTTLVVDVDYTVSGVEAVNGGSIVLTAGNLPTDYLLSILSNVTYYQNTDLRNQGKYRPSAVERQFDRIVRMVKQLLEKFVRTITVPEGDTNSNLVLPTATARANSYLAFDTNGDVMASPGSIVGYPVTAYIETLLNDADAATARATLGAGAAGSAVFTAITIAAARAVIEALGDKDNTFLLKNAADDSKQLDFNLVNVATATKRTLTPMNKDGTPAIYEDGFALANFGLSISVDANALTVALKTAAGDDPSAGDPVFIPFRNVSLTSGVPDGLKVTGGVSITASNGSSLGTVSGQAHRIYVVAINDGGTPRLGLWNPWDVSTSQPALQGIDDLNLYSALAEGGVGNADSARVLYSNAAVSSKAVKVLGYFESTQASAGVWVTPPSKVQEMAPGIKRTGDIVQVVRYDTGAYANGTTLIPSDDTIPQITEGIEFMTIGVVPTSPANLLRISAAGRLSSSVANNMSAALFVDAVANALTSIEFGPTASNGRFVFPLLHLMIANTTALMTFRYRGGGSLAGTTGFNGTAAGRVHGGTMNSYMNIEEIFV